MTTLPGNINDREFEKFVASPTAKVQVRVQDSSTDLSTGSNQVTDISPALTSISESTLFSAVTAAGTSAAVNAVLFNKHTVHVTSSSVTSGVTVQVESSLDDTNYAAVETFSVTSNTVTEKLYNDRKYKFIRVLLLERTDGTYTVKLLNGN